MVSFADPETGEIDEDMHLQVKINTAPQRNDGIDAPESGATFAMLLDIMFIDDPKYNLLVCSSNDGKIRMYKYNGVFVCLNSNYCIFEGLKTYQNLCGLMCTHKRHNGKIFVPASDNNQKKDSELDLKTAQLIIVWDKVNEILYSGERSGLIRIWEQKSVNLKAHQGTPVQDSGQKEKPDSQR